MIDRISQVMQEGTRRYPLLYRRMINCIYDRFSYIRNTFLIGSPAKTPGTMLLRYLISNLNVVKLSTMSSDIERYTSTIKFFKHSYLQAFDPVMNGSIKGGKWISNNSAGVIMPPEVILNVDCESPLDMLPLDKPWVDWQILRGFRFLYHDSLELIERFNTCMLTFRVQKPTILVVSLDVAILLFKYYKYWEDCLNHGVSADIDEFIMRYEYTYLFDDLLDIWTLNLLSLIFSHPEMSTRDIINKLTVPQRICTDTMLSQGIDGAKQFIDLIKHGSVKPQDFLETRWFVDNTVREKMDQLDQWCTVPDRRQYLWCNALMWLPYLRLLLILTNMFPEGAVNQLIKNRFEQLYIRKFKYAAMPGLANSKALQEFITKLNEDIRQCLTNRTLVAKSENFRPHPSNHRYSL